MLSMGSRVASVERAAARAVAAETLVDSAARHAAWFHELDAWTQYWDIYHPETRGRYHFGNGTTEPGLLSRFLCKEKRPAVANAWFRMALGYGTREKFIEEARAPEVAAAVLEVDRLAGRLFAKHFGDASDPQVRDDYINALLCYGCGTLPPAIERAARFADDDPRKPGAARYAMEYDLAWFCCAIQLQAVYAIFGADEDHPRRSLMLAGLAVGCSADFTWGGRRQTRPVYGRDFQTAYLLRHLGADWSQDFEAAAREMHALFRIREWGHEAVHAV
jgi:hypothetical protein